MLFNDSGKEKGIEKEWKGNSKGVEREKKGKVDYGHPTLIKYWQI